MSVNDDRRAILPAPIQYQNPQSAASPRYDDEHRGPAVSDAYELSRCWIDLMEVSRDWPLPSDLPPHMVEFAQRVPEDQRQEWLRAQSASEEVIRRISRAMRSGELPIWVAPKDAPERVVAPSAMLEVDGATIKAGCYRPPNDRGWLYGRPLFVKINDWNGFVETTQSQMTAAPTKAANVDDPGDAGWIAGLPAGWICAHTAVVRFCHNLMGDADTSDASQTAKRDARIVSAFRAALLTGKLSASIFDGHNLRPLPKAAFVHNHVIDAGLRNGSIEFDPLWPDEWRSWNGHGWAFEKQTFNAWLASDDVFETEGSTGEMTAAEMIFPIAAREPSQRNRVPLSEAVSWIAFGLALDADRLSDAAIRWASLAGGDLQETQHRIAQAVEALVSAGADGKIALYARQAGDRRSDPGLTEKIEPHRLDDYRQYLIGADKLHGGQGLKRWYSAPDHYNSKPSDRSDLFSNVTVCRADLMEHFPAAVKTTEAVPVAITIGELSLPGEDFDPKADVSVSPWWSFLQVIGWITTRSKAYADYVAKLEGDGRDDVANAVVQSAVITYVARNYCKCAAESLPDHSRWKACTCIGDAGRLLLEAIRVGSILPTQVSAVGPKKLSFHDLAGIGQEAFGGDWLDIKPVLQFSSAEVLAAFPIEISADVSVPVTAGLSTVAAESECKTWLVAAFANDPNRRRNKASFRDDALQHFAGRLTERGFNLRVWPSIAKQNGRDGAGAKKKS